MEKVVKQGFVTPSWPKAAFVPAYRLAGRKIIDQDSLLKVFSNLLK
jgi:hypothetical protein